jgi:hypothetical protein
MTVFSKKLLLRQQCNKLDVGEMLVHDKRIFSRTKPFLDRFHDRSKVNALCCILENALQTSKRKQTQVNASKR